MPTAKNNSKSSSDSNKSKTNISKKNNGSNDSQSTGIAGASPTAREKAKDMDSNRRSDAQSNEL